MKNNQNNIEIIEWEEEHDADFIVYTSKNWGYIDENGNKVHHRDGDLPAIIENYHQDGIFCEKFLSLGKHIREDGKPTSTTYHIDSIGTRILLEETFLNEEGEIHRDGDQPAITGYLPNRQISFVDYFKNGKAHRDGNKPSRIVFDHNSNIQEESYSVNGMLHREDGPAYFTKSEDKTFQAFYVNDKIHNDKGPALITTYKHMKIVEYYLNDLCHRDGDKPAIIKTRADGSLIEEIYKKDDKYHRDGDKPAFISYREDGTVSQTSYFRDGKYFRDGYKPTCVNHDKNGQEIIEAPEEKVKNTTRFPSSKF